MGEELSRWILPRYEVFLQWSVPTLALKGCEDA
jgi:hypothetical protein